MPSKLARDLADYHGLSPLPTNLLRIISQHHKISYVPCMRGIIFQLPLNEHYSAEKGFHLMHGLEWVFSIVLAIVFLVTGVFKVFRYTKAQTLFSWAKDMPRILVQAIGIVEILGALGLVLPVAAGFYPWLTPVAAIVLGSLMLSAATFHVLRREKDEAILPVFLLILLAVVAYIRWPLMP